jgi:glycerol dehydrogenase-like iron-containing ADH family enzyme
MTARAADAVEPALPELVFCEQDLRQTAIECMAPATLIVTDDYNMAAVRDLAPTVCVKDQEFEHIEAVKSTHKYDRVVAIGGCTALDFGRACAPGKYLLAIPTILSTSCLSTNCSVIKRNGIYRSVRTQAPHRTLISLPTIVRNHGDEVRKWSISGLGDLFASVSASIECEYERNARSLQSRTSADVLKNIPTVTVAMEWVLGSLDRFDESNLRKLAVMLHEASVDIIRHGQQALNAASEHWLYYKMQERRNYPKMLATHGKLVSMGTLISCRIFAEQTGDHELERKLRAIHARLGLPRCFADLEAFGISPDHIVAGLRELADRDCLYRDYFASHDYSILARTFA